MNLIESSSCCICFEGDPDNYDNSYNRELNFQPNKQQQDDGEIHVNPVRMHTAKPVAFNEITKKYEIICNPETGKPMPGKIHWCCDVCVLKLERADRTDTYDCVLCREVVVKRNAKRKAIILDEIDEDRCSAALLKVKSLFAELKKEDNIGSAVPEISCKCIEMNRGNEILQYILGEIFIDTNQEMLETYDPTNVIARTAMTCRNASALAMVFKAVKDKHTIHASNFMCYELSRCIWDGTKNMDIISVLLQNGADPLWVDPELKQTNFKLFLKTARNLDKKMEYEHLETYKMFMEVILDNPLFMQHVNDHRMEQHEMQDRNASIDPRLLNRMFSENSSKNHNAYTLVGNVAMMRQMSKENLGGDLFPLHGLANAMNPMFGLDRFLQDDFESVIFPRLKFFQEQNVSIDACENGLTPITSLLNDAYYIEIKTPESVNADLCRQQGHDRRVRLNNIRKIIEFFQALGVSRLHELLDINVSAVDLLVYLSGYSDDYKHLLIDKLGWGRGYYVLRWPLSKKGVVNDNFYANENSKWHGSIRNIPGVFDMHGKSDLLDLYVGILSPKTALMYIQKIMQFDQPRCTNIHSFKHIICKTVKAYNEHEKKNDLAKQKCTLKMCSAIFLGWHPFLDNTLHALLQTGFDFARIAETFLEILKKLPVHVAESVFRVVIAKKHDQANIAKLTSRLIYEAFSEVSSKRNLDLSQYEDEDYPVVQHHDADFYPEPV
jgi:hypothetical protein